MIPLSKFKNKKVLILGLGEEGIDNFLFFKNNISCKAIGVADKLPFEKLSVKARNCLKSATNLYLGRNYLSAVEKYEIIVKSPGIPLHLLSIKKGQILTSQSDILLSNTKAKVIGITGTKGKSTTASLIHTCLSRAGFSSHLIGNIGVPALSRLTKEKKGDIFVYELSSFQLATVTESPHIAVMLNIFTDHLDKHKNFEEYVSSKEKITAFQKKKDFLIYNENDEIVEKIAKKSSARKIPFSDTEETKSAVAPLDAVYKTVKILGVSFSDVKKAATEFKGLPHRMEYIGKYKGIDFYNDSAATIPEASAKAINELENIQTVILGGVSKGADQNSLLEAIKKSKIGNIVLFKGSPKEFEEGLEKTGRIIFPAADMREAVEHCFRNTNGGKGCLLSPGFASFNMFRDYKERGELFKSFVREFEK